MYCIHMYVPNNEWHEISLALTAQCNLRCRHCITEADIGKEEHFDTDQMYKILDKIIKVRPHNLILTGDEFMIRTDFFQLLAYIRKRYFLFGNKKFLRKEVLTKGVL